MNDDARQEFQSERLQKLGIERDPDPDHPLPMPYKPYAGGSKFPMIETLSEKPGFKIWVDGGVLDYNDELCLAKQLDCR